MTQKRSRGERAGLTREKILDAALALVDQEGPGALSMRRLGAELGVEAMTLYHYLPNKDALLDGLVERVIAEASLSAAEPRDGEDGPTPWQDALSTYARSLRAALLLHPGTLPLVSSRPATTPGTLTAVERGLEILRGADFPLGQALHAFNSLTLFVVAHAASEVDTAPVNERGASGSTDFLAGLDPEELPLLVEAASTGAGTDDEERFAFGLTALISGFAAARGH